MDSLTPDVTQSPCCGIIDISDEDDVNYNENIPKVKKVSGSRKYVDLTESQRSFENKLQKTNLEYVDEEHMDEFRVHSSNIGSVRDDEDSYDDNALICTLITQHSSRVMTALEEEVKSYPARLRKSEYDSKQEKSNFDSIKTVVSCEDKEDNDGVDELESNLQKTNLEYIDEELTNEFRVHSSNTRSVKRKRNMVISDDEDSDDDNALICTLKTQHGSRFGTESEEEVTEIVSRGCATRLRKSKYDSKQERSNSDSNTTVVSSEDTEDNDGVAESENNLQKTNLEYIDEEHTDEFRVHSSNIRSASDDEDSDDESLDGFIDDSPESVTDCEYESSDSNNESEDALNESIDYDAILEKISRKKNPNMGWDLKGDMLSDFGKDPALCMSAVCAIYRQQTADEKESKETRYRNKRGFSQADAPRGSKLAEFLMDGDSNGDLNKTVEELEEYDSKGIEQCMHLAAKYSNQLWQIYRKKEDPCFPPQR